MSLETRHPVSHPSPRPWFARPAHQALPSGPWKRVQPVLSACSDRRFFLFISLLQSALRASPPEAMDSTIADSGYLPTRRPPWYASAPPVDAENAALWARLCEGSAAPRQSAWEWASPRERLCAEIGEALLTAPGFFAATQNLALNAAGDLVAVYVPQRRELLLRSDLSDCKWHHLSVQTLPGPANPLLGSVPCEPIAISEVLWLTGIHHPSAVDLVGNKPGQLRLALRRLPEVATASIQPRHLRLLTALGRGPSSLCALARSAKLSDYDLVAAVLPLVLTRSVRFS